MRSASALTIPTATCAVAAGLRRVTTKLGCIDPIASAPEGISVPLARLPVRFAPLANTAKTQLPHALIAPLAITAAPARAPAWNAVEATKRYPLAPQRATNVQPANTVAVVRVQCLIARHVPLESTRAVQA